MAEYIYSICKRCFHSYVCEQFNEHRDTNNQKCHFFADHFVPAANVEPVRHGRWVDKKEWHFGRWVAWYECSCCGERDENYEMYEMMPFCSLSNYCPNCGARMDLEVSE